MSFIIAIP